MVVRSKAASRFATSAIVDIQGLAVATGSKIEREETTTKCCRLTWEWLAVV